MTKFKTLEEYLIKHRRHLHQNPEIGFNCVETHDYIRDELNKLAIPYFEHIGKNSIIGFINNGNKPIIGLRADFDALPIQEATDLVFKSVNSGVMHACGHDAHTGMLLGAAKYLVENKKEWKGTVKLIFQEAEEGPNPGGALAIVESGIVDDVEDFYALHVSSSDEAGTFLLSKGEALASADTLKIKFNGKGVHAAYPHLGVDPIIMQAEFITAIQTIISRKKNPMDRGVITIAQVKAGTTHNIIPEFAYVEGTVRAFSEDVREMFEKELRILAEGIAASNGGSCDFEYIREYDPLINTNKESQLMLDVAKSVFGEEKCTVLDQPSMGAEDFSRYVNHRRGSLGWLGVGYKGKYNYPAHHPKFEIDESALLNGSKVLINIVKRIGEEYVSD